VTGLGFTRQIGSIIPALIGVTLVAFLMVRLLPGDPIAVMTEGANLSPEQVQSLRDELGLDSPLPVEYARFVGRAVQGDLGESIRSGESVSWLIRANLPSTLQLTAAGMLVGVVIGFALGILAALRQNTFIDTAVIAFANLGFAMPAFWLAAIFIYLFSVQWQFFPATSAGMGRGIVLPALALGWGLASVIARLVRSTLIETLDQDFVRAARAKGLAERTVLVRHAVRCTLIPVVTVLGLQFGHLLGGAVVVEVVFARPGLGRLMVTAILDRDYPVVQGAILVACVVYILVNLAVDLTYRRIDPRVGTAS